MNSEHKGELEDQFSCPSCEAEVEQLFEGYCKPCLEHRQRQLDVFNYTTDHWENLTPQQRDFEIKNAY